MTDSPESVIATLLGSPALRARSRRGRVPPPLSTIRCNALSYGPRRNGGAFFFVTNCVTSAAAERDDGTGVMRGNKNAEESRKRQMPSGTTIADAGTHADYPIVNYLNLRTSCATGENK